MALRLSISFILFLAGAFAQARLGPTCGDSQHLEPTGDHYSCVPNAGVNFVTKDANGNVSTSGTVSGAMKDKGGQVYNVQSYGVLPDGTDHSAEFTALLATVYSAAGGTIYFPASSAKYRLDSCFTLPNDGATLPTQPPFRLVGAGSSPNTPADTVAPPTGGSIIDTRCSTGTATIDSRGNGYLEVSGISFYNGGSSNKPFIQTTNTQVNIHDNGFWGNASCSGQTCIQDAIYLGGTTTALDGTATAAFQGYGAIVDRNFFTGIRQGVYARTYANGVWIEHNTFWHRNGAADNTTAAIHINGIVSGTAGGCVCNNLIEASYYPVSILVEIATETLFINNTFYDVNTTAEAYIRFSTNAKWNTVIAGLGAKAFGHPTKLYDDVDGRNSIHWVDISTDGYRIDTPRLDVSGPINGLTIGNSAVKLFGTTSSYPAIYQAGANLKLLRGDLNAYVSMGALNLFSNGGLQQSSSANVTWSNATTNPFDAGPADVGLARSAAGVLKVTDGSTGAGKLILQLPTSCTGLATRTLYDTGSAIGFCP